MMTGEAAKANQLLEDSMFLANGAAMPSETGTEQVLLVFYEFSPLHIYSQN